MQVLAADKDVLAYTRVLPAKGSDRVIVVVNRSAAASTVNLKLGGTVLAGTLQPQTVLGDGVVRWVSDDVHVEMPGSSVWIGLIH
jgi:hypothetical protein